MLDLNIVIDLTSLFKDIQLNFDLGSYVTFAVAFSAKKSDE